MQTLTTSLRSPDLQPVTAIPHQYHGGELPEAQQGLSQHLSSQGVTPQSVRILPYMDDYLLFFGSREAAVWGVPQVQCTWALPKGAERRHRRHVKAAERSRTSRRQARQVVPAGSLHQQNFG